MEEALLRQIANQIGDLAAMYRLVNKERIARAMEEVLGDGTKRKLWELADGRRSQAELAKATKVSPQRASQIVAELTDAGVVGRTADGKWLRRLE